MLKKGHKDVNILGVRIDSTSKDEVLRVVGSGAEKLMIFTPNPEQVVLAQSDLDFQKILNSADINIPDGIGLVASYKFLSLPATCPYILRPVLYFAQGLGVVFSIFFDRSWLGYDLRVIRGRDLFYELVKLADEKGWRAFLLGDAHKSAQKAEAELKRKFTNVKFFSASGPSLDSKGNPIARSDREVERNVIEKINKISPDVVFVGFGAPKQEKWVYRWFSKLKVRCVMVVGGTFDYVTGKNKLPPKFVADVGLEWLWRLLTGSQKWERIKVALVDFPMKVFSARLDKA